MKTFVSLLTAIVTLLPAGLAAADLGAVDFEGDKMTSKGNVSLITGNVRVKHRDASMKADRATYDTASKTITLEGSVRVQRDKTEVTAEKVIYFVETQKVQVEGPNRTKLLDTK